MHVFLVRHHLSLSSAFRVPEWTLIDFSGTIIHMVLVQFTLYPPYGHEIYGAHLRICYNNLHLFIA